MSAIPVYFSPRMKVFVIIPAAGLGTRMAPAGKKAAASKQFVEINGAPILIHTLRAFARNRQVSEIVVALRQTEMEQVQALLENEKLAGRVTLVEGGEHRQQSVGNALARIAAAADVVIRDQDADRRFVVVDIFSGVIR